MVDKLEADKDKLRALSQARFWQRVAALAALAAQRAYEQEQRDSLAPTHPAGQRLMTMPGLGPFTATACVAAVSDASACKNGRQCAAWLG